MPQVACLISVLRLGSAGLKRKEGETIMKLKSGLFALCLALATPAVAQNSGETVTPDSAHPTATIPGLSVKAVAVDDARGHTAPSLSYAKSAFAHNYVLSGAIKTLAEGDPMRFFRLLRSSMGYRRDIISSAAMRARQSW